MNRLTKKDAHGNWALRGVNWWQLYTGQTITREVQEKLYGALHKLLDYEEVGMSPDEIENLKKESEWIPVNVKMPKERTHHKYSDRVFVTIKFNNWKQVSTAWTEHGEWVMEPGQNWGKVIAWKPFPEPYKEKNNE